MTIPCHLSRLYLFSMLEHDMDFGQGHGISMAFAKKMTGFPPDLVTFLTKLPSESHEKIPVTFFTDSHTNCFRKSYDYPKRNLSFLFRSWQFRDVK